MTTSRRLSALVINAWAVALSEGQLALLRLAVGERWPWWLYGAHYTMCFAYGVVAGLSWWRAGKVRRRTRDQVNS